MKQFLTFDHDVFYPQGGTFDLRGSYDTLAAAQASFTPGKDIQEVLNTQSGKVWRRNKSAYSDAYGAWESEPALTSP